jgi:hypothetical protein
MCWSIWHIGFHAKFNDWTPFEKAMSQLKPITKLIAGTTIVAILPNVRHMPQPPISGRVLEFRKMDHARLRRSERTVRDSLGGNPVAIRSALRDDARNVIFMLKRK